MINRKYIDSCREQSRALYKQAAALEKRAGVAEILERAGKLPVISDFTKAAESVKKAKEAAAALKVKQAEATKAQEAESHDAKAAVEAADAAADVAKREKDDAIKAATITGGGIAAGGVAGGLLGRYLAPEKYRRLATALGVLAGAGIGGAGAHLGQKYLQA